jgi:hypothetical protein
MWKLEFGIWNAWDMRTPTRTALAATVFFLIAPGTAAGLIPFAITRWRMQPPFLGWTGVPLIGGILAAIGLAGLVECTRRFVVEGRGTPAPIAPPRSWSFPAFTGTSGTRCMSR